MCYYKCIRKTQKKTLSKHYFQWNAIVKYYYYYYISQNFAILFFTFYFVVFLFAFSFFFLIFLSICFLSYFLKFHFSIVYSILLGSMCKRAEMNVGFWYLFLIHSFMVFPANTHRPFQNNQRIFVMFSLLKPQSLLFLFFIILISFVSILPSLLDSLLTKPRQLVFFLCVCVCLCRSLSLQHPKKK